MAIQTRLYVAVSGVKGCDVNLIISTSRAILID